ncbi:hypothetical protein CERZMDRAFT_93172 [Cercospora zeae-maydis SCOH1-5]|uniref:Uncharacterized protein n=1 Tax=Cercospora zeae-maydis SCOH1-5 TaxID=717836 RepID=A0A6A6FUU7_9PEZI|nr:hypothetical protein CERZMDRAFT_93172 [Cercospora zeae-maydis SCOH1-5]
MTQEEKMDIDQEVAKDSAPVAVAENLEEEATSVQDTHTEEPATPSVQPKPTAPAPSNTGDETATSQDVKSTKEAKIQAENPPIQQAIDEVDGENDIDMASISVPVEIQPSEAKTESPRDSFFDDSDSDEEAELPKVSKLDGINVIPAIVVDGDKPVWNRQRAVKARSAGRQRAALYGRKHYDMPYVPSGLRLSYTPQEYCFDCDAARVAKLTKIDTSLRPQKRPGSIDSKTSFEQPRDAPSPIKAKGPRRSNAVTNAALPLPSQQAMLNDYRRKYSQYHQKFYDCREQLQIQCQQLKRERESLRQAEKLAKDKDRQHGEDMNDLLEEVNDACTQLRVSKGDYENRLDLLQQKLDESVANIKQIEVDRDDARASLLALRNSLEEHKAALEAAETQITKLQTEQDIQKQCQTRNDQLQVQLNAFLSQHQAFEQKNEQLQSHLRQLSHQLHGTHDMIEKLQTEKAELEQANRRLERQVALRSISEARSVPWEKRRQAWRREPAWKEQHRILVQRAKREDQQRREYEMAREYALEDLKLPPPDATFYHYLAGRVTGSARGEQVSNAREVNARRPTWLSEWRKHLSPSLSWYW